MEGRRKGLGLFQFLGFAICIISSNHLFLILLEFGPWSECIYISCIGESIISYIMRVIQIININRFDDISMLGYISTHIHEKYNYRNFYFLRSISISNKGTVPWRVANNILMWLMEYVFFMRIKFSPVCLCSILCCQTCRIFHIFELRCSKIHFSRTYCQY